MTNLTKRQKEIFLIILSIVFFVVLVGYSYLNIYSPIKEETNQVKINLTNEREVLLALRKQFAEEDSTDTSSSLPLQRKVPVKPLEDSVLLQIRKAEVKSDSTVTDLSFRIGELTFEDSSEGKMEISELITEVQLEVSSYETIEIFINEIEQMERIFVINEINFRGPDEIKILPQDQSLLNVTVVFSAFYRADLVDLVDEVPKVDVPAAEGKINPFPFNGGTEVGDD